MANSRETVKTCERLAEQVQQLAEAIATPGNSDFGDRLQPEQSSSNSTIEEEVSRPFGRPMPGTVAEQQLQSVGDRGRARAAEDGRMTAPVFTLRSKFLGSLPSRPKSSSCSVRPGNNANTSKPGPFLRDIFLFSGPQNACDQVLRQGAHPWLIESGYQLTELHWG